MSKEREPASGVPEGARRATEELPKSGVMVGAGGRPSASMRRFCGCFAEKTSKHFHANWA